MHFLIIALAVAAAAAAAAAYEVVFMNHPKIHYVLNFVLGENY